MRAGGPPSAGLILSATSPQYSRCPPASGSALSVVDLMASATALRDLPPAACGRSARFTADLWRLRARARSSHYDSGREKAQGDAG